MALPQRWWLNRDHILRFSPIAEVPDRQTPGDAEAGSRLNSVPHSPIVICRRSKRLSIHDEAALAAVGNPGITGADPSQEVRHDSATRRIRPSVHR